MKWWKDSNTLHASAILHACTVVVGGVGPAGVGWNLGLKDPTSSSRGSFYSLDSNFFLSLLDSPVWVFRPIKSRDLWKKLMKQTPPKLQSRSKHCAFQNNWPFGAKVDWIRSNRRLSYGQRYVDKESPTSYLLNELVLRTTILRSTRPGRFSTELL